MPGLESEVVALRKRVDDLERKEQATGKLLYTLLEIFIDRLSGQTPKPLYPGHLEILAKVSVPFQEAHKERLPAWVKVMRISHD